MHVAGQENICPHNIDAAVAIQAGTRDQITSPIEDTALKKDILEVDILDSPRNNLLLKVIQSEMKILLDVVYTTKRNNAVG